MTRRRIIIANPLPTFAIGIPSQKQKKLRGPKPCTKSANTYHIKPSILTCSNSLPQSLWLEYSACQIGILKRQEKLRLLQQIYELYTNLQDKFYGIPLEKYKEEMILGKKWIEIESRCSTAFRCLAALWLYKKYKNRYLNTEDPATLCEPIKPIQFFDGRLRGTYTFEATTLKKHIEGSLSYAEWLVPYPKPPMNPLTNIPFTKAQLSKILDDMRSYRIGSWMFEAYRRLEFILPIFREIFMVPVKIRALEDMVRNPTNETTIELVTEFVEDEFESGEIPFTTHLDIIKWAIEKMSEHPYIKEWLNLYHSYTSSVILYGTNIDKINDIELDVHNSAMELFERHETILEIGRLRLKSMTRRYRIPLYTVVVPVVPIEILLSVETNEQDTAQ